MVQGTVVLITTRISAAERMGEGDVGNAEENKRREVTLQDALESCLQERCAGMSETRQKTKEKVSSTRTKASGRAVHKAQPARCCCCATLKKLPRCKVWWMLVPHSWHTWLWRGFLVYTVKRIFRSLEVLWMRTAKVIKQIILWAKLRGANVALQNLAWTIGNGYRWFHTL